MCSSYFNHTIHICTPITIINNPWVFRKLIPIIMPPPKLMALPRTPHRSITNRSSKGGMCLLCLSVKCMSPFFMEKPTPLTPNKPVSRRPAYNIPNIYIVLDTTYDARYDTGNNFPPTCFLNGRGP